MFIHVSLTVSIDRDADGIKEVLFAVEFGIICQEGCNPCECLNQRLGLCLHYKTIEGSL